MNITIHRDGQNYGPYSLEDVRQHLGTGSLALTDLAFVEGASEWTTLSQLPGVASSTPPPPPPPPVQASIPDVNCLNRRSFGWMVDNLLFCIITLPIALGIEMLIPDFEDHGGFFIMWPFYAPFVAYFISSEFQATPGMMLFGVVATDMQGKRISYRRALVRHLISFVTFICIIGLFLVNKKRQYLHDMAAGTIVIKKPLDFNVSRSPWIPIAAMAGPSILLTIGIVALGYAARYIISTQ